MLRSKKSNCAGLEAVALVGLTCTQYSRQLRACPRAASVQPEPGVATGRVAMARRTVSGVDPSASVQVSGFRDAIPGGFQPHEAIIRPTNTSAAINRRTPQSYGRSKTRFDQSLLGAGLGRVLALRRNLDHGRRHWRRA